MDVPVTDESGQPLTNQDGTPATTKQPKINRVETTKSRVIAKDNIYISKHARDVQRDPVIIKESYLYKDLADMERRNFCVNVSTKLKSHIMVPEVPNSNMSPEEKERLRAVKLRNQPVDIIRWYGHYDVDGFGIPESIRIIISPQYRLYLGGVRMRSITKSGRRPLDFTKYDSYIDRQDELDGEGVLHKVRELAEEIDACFNQMTDAHTLAVLRPFFYDPSGDIDAPAITLGPNKGIPVTDPKNNVYFPDVNIPTERLLNAITLVLEMIERLTAASDYVMGRESDIVGGSGTATRTQAIVQSATIRFTLPSERLRAGAARILNNQLDLIQLNIPPGFEERVLGEKGDPVFLQGELSDEGLSGRFDAYLLPDPSMGSKESERQLYDMVYNILMQNPITATDPNKIYMLSQDWLKSRGIEPEKAVRYLGPPPEVDDIDDPLDENTLMLQGDFKRVTPNIAENHLHHIKTHQDMLASPAFARIAKVTPELAQEVAQYAQLHIQQHLQMFQSVLAMMQKVGGKPTNGTNGSEPGTGQSPTPDGSKPGVENTQGPMGEALNTKRKGEVGKTSGA